MSITISKDGQSQVKIYCYLGGWLRKLLMAMQVPLITILNTIYIYEMQLGLQITEHLQALLHLNSIQLPVLKL